MKRGGGAEIFLRSIDEMRRTIPDVTLRTSFIVGFPGETDRQFEELCQFVREAEFDWMGAFGYSENHTVLHTGSGLLPKADRAKASWNYLMPACETSSAEVVVSYDMNRLQRLDSETRYLVTLNSDGAVAEDSVLEQMVYEHPIFTPDSGAAGADGAVAGASAVFFGSSLPQP
jgi:predicted NAD/FAD-binding protein